MTTKFAELDLGLIDKHPKNPRHKATADHELVDSVRAAGLVQPIVVAPVPPPEGYTGSPETGWSKPGMGVTMQRYVLIAGHRRADACKKAKLKTVPAIIREDLNTEQAQIEAMLIENGRREDLTPIEEAEGYHQLELLGYKPQAIATAVGRDVKTVRGRLKLLKLSATTKKKVHAGQLRLEDAAAISEFAADEAATKRLEQAAKSGDLKYTLQRERGRRDTLRRNAARVAKLLEAGATELQLKSQTPAGYVYDNDLPDGSVRLTRTPSTDWGQHKDCLAFVQTQGNDWSAPEVVELCADPASHKHQLDEEERSRAEAREKEQAEQAAREAAEEAAAAVRLQTIMDLVGTATPLPPAFADIARALLPAMLRELGYNSEPYFDALGVDEADRFKPHVFSYPREDKARQKAETLFAQHASDIADASAGQLTRHLVALLLAYAENTMTSAYRTDPACAADYLCLLEEAGHEFCEIDQELRVKITAKRDQAAS